MFKTIKSPDEIGNPLVAEGFCCLIFCTPPPPPSPPEPGQEKTLISSCGADTGHTSFRQLGKCVLTKEDIYIYPYTVELKAYPPSSVQNK